MAVNRGWFKRRGERVNGHGQTRQSVTSPKSCGGCGSRGGVVDSVRYEDYVRRRYACAGCGGRWSTYEVKLEGEDLE